MLNNFSFSDLFQIRAYPAREGTSEMGESLADWHFS